MTMKKYEHVIKELADKRRELLERLDRISISKRKAHDTDSDEQAIERENDEVVDALGENILKELEQINKAISRIENNTYDICSACNENIPLERLKALPYTDRCINCAS